MLNKKILLLYVFSSLFAISYSQSILVYRDSSYAFSLIPSIGVSFQHHVNAEAGIMYGKSDYDMAAYKLFRYEYYTKIASELYLVGKTPYIGPKVSFEIMYGYFGVRANLIDYTDFKAYDFRFIPEVGICLGYVLGIYYGYNIPIGASRINNIVGNRLTLNINFISKYHWDRRRERSHT